jgi:four helix bundle protein
MDSKELRERTKKFAMEIIKYVDGLKQSPSTIVLSKQIIRSATSIGANYRAACGALSKSEFIAKLQITREESDETLYWLELIQVVNRQKNAEILLKECNELTAIFTAALKTARSSK